MVKRLAKTGITVCATIHSPTPTGAHVGMQSWVSFTGRMLAQQNVRQLVSNRRMMTSVVCAGLQHSASLTA